MAPSPIGKEEIPVGSLHNKARKPENFCLSSATSQTIWIEKNGIICEPFKLDQQIMEKHI